MGKAWGLNCENCPIRGGSDYKALCGSGPPGVMINPMTNQSEEIDECQLMPGITSNRCCFLILLNMNKNPKTITHNIYII